MDTDEQLSVVNFNPKTVAPDWCGPQHPPLITRILEQMLFTATQSKLDWYDVMMTSAKGGDVLSPANACAMGMSYCKTCGRCKKITAFLMPVHLWIREPNTEWSAIPTIRSNYPCHYAPNIKGAPRRGHEEQWKAIYNTKNNPPLSGMSVHGNDIKSDLLFYLLAPRDFHGRLSLELVHQRGGADRELSKQNITELMSRDTRILDLFDSYRRCMHSLK